MLEYQAGALWRRYPRIPSTTPKAVRDRGKYAERGVLFLSGFAEFRPRIRSSKFMAATNGEKICTRWKYALSSKKNWNRRLKRFEPVWTKTGTDLEAAARAPYYLSSLEGQVDLSGEQTWDH